MSVVAAQLISIVEIDGLPYLSVDWLERRIYRNEVRIQRWQQEARRVERRTDPEGLSMRSAYLHHAREAAHRADKWKRCLAITQGAIRDRQMNAWIGFGLLVNSRRIAAGMTLIDLGSRAGIDAKTVRHIENAAFRPYHRTLAAIIAVSDLGISLNDVSPILLEDNPTDRRKHRQRRKSRISRGAREKIANNSLAEAPTG